MTLKKQFKVTGTQWGASEWIDPLVVQFGWKDSVYKPLTKHELNDSIGLERVLITQSSQVCDTEKTYYYNYFTALSLVYFYNVRLYANIWQNGYNKNTSPQFDTQEKSGIHPML